MKTKASFTWNDRLRDSQTFFLEPELEHMKFLTFAEFEEYENESSTLKFWEFDSQIQTWQKWAEDGHKRNDHRLSLPSFSRHRPLYPDHALIFSRAFHLRVIPTREPASNANSYPALFKGVLLQNTGQNIVYMTIFLRAIFL